MALAAALNAPAANAAFADALLVIDGDPARDPSATSGSATLVRVGPRRHLDVIRNGIHDAAFAGDTGRFLQNLTHHRERSRRGGPIPGPAANPGIGHMAGGAGSSRGGQPAAD